MGDFAISIGLLATYDEFLKTRKPTRNLRRRFCDCALHTSNATLIIFFLSAFFALTARASAALYNPGDLVVADDQDNTAPLILDINPNTGAQRVISSGGLLVQPAGLCFDAMGNLIVADYGAINNQNGRILRIDRNSGQQSVVASGGNIIFPISVALAPNGQLVFAQQDTTEVHGSVLSVDPTSGRQTIVSSGNLLSSVESLIVDSQGNYLVSNALAGANQGSIIRINSQSGVQTTLVPGVPNVLPGNLLLDRTNPGDLIETENTVNNSTLSGLTEVNLSNGSRVNISAGNKLQFPGDTCEDNFGNLYVTALASLSTHTGLIVKVDPATGTQTVIASGGSLEDPTAILSVPEPSSIGLIAAVTFVMLLRPKVAARRCGEPKRGHY